MEFEFCGSRGLFADWGSGESPKDPVDGGETSPGPGDEGHEGHDGVSVKSGRSEAFRGASEASCRGIAVIPSRVSGRETEGKFRTVSLAAHREIDIEFLVF